MLTEKVARLEEAWTQKDKFIHSSRMIVRFREDHISRLEKRLKAEQGSLTDTDSQALINQLKEEIKILREQVQTKHQLNNVWTFLFVNVQSFMVCEKCNLEFEV